ncbi:MAG TPA: STAS/SEC14 domain-containing protein [Chryseobacterium sp.]|nr:STAS/SEC14 domain-containing protein [Chryseobacterium sp.]
MITIIPEAPDNVAAFNATGEVTKEDFEKLVIPRVKEKVDQFGELNYLLYLDTDLDNFTMGAWLEDMLLGLKNLARWNRAAIVTDKEGIRNFTSIFSVLMPGEFKSFPKENLYNALYWCKNGDEVEA